MSHLSVRALVLSSRVHKESSRILWILTKEHGILHCTASGAASSGSSFSSGSQPAILADFVLNRSRDYWYVKEVEVVESFRKIREDITLLTTAAHLFEIAGDVCTDADTGAEVMLLLLYALHILETGKKDYRLVVSAVEWRLCGILGFPAPMDPSFMDISGYAVFSFTECCFYVKNKGLQKEGEHTMILSAGCLQALYFVQNVSREKLFSFAVTETVQDELSLFTQRYISERLEKNYAKMQLLNPVYLHDV